MSNKDRNVIERLDDIEEKITKTDKKVWSFSETTGMTIDEYIEKSYIFAYDGDERFFNKQMRVKKTRLFTFIIVTLLVLIASIVMLIIKKGQEWLLIIGPCLALLHQLLSIVFVYKQKIHQPIKSFWNKKRLSFYVLHNEESFSIKKEESHSALFYLLLLTIILSFSGVIPAFIYFVVSLNSETNQAIGVVFLVIQAIVSIFFSEFVLFSGAEYNYPYYAFETKDSYFVYPGYHYFEK